MFPFIFGNFLGYNAKSRFRQRLREAAHDRLVSEVRPERVEKLERPGAIDWSRPRPAFPGL